ncbi:retinaldehyde-binding protein 1 [Folsomia candida]|uniref:Retinaldehyde-binding protein 1 n=1 Tax=Folsomia candida TaxID=158441 RepID=A0A226EVW7_FOLCA|nr:retinaldehyde-binding protein 1 [Folsomia candida]OXA61234.1 Retinaldehyde-binding protein 1 [Folsomia candida]
MGKGSPTPLDQPAELNFTEDYGYTSTLTPVLRQVAKKELREDDRIRDQALGEMRQWIKKTSYIKNCRLDANFLLRFLRHKKYHVPMAQDTLVRYITMRQEHPHWFNNTSMYDPVVLDLINRGVAFALPERDRHGRRVLFTVGGNIDPYKHRAEDVMKAIMVCFESLLEDEENQVQGFSYILDESGITTTHLANLWRPSEMTKIFATTEKGMPMRHRSMQFMRLPLIVSAVFNFAKTLMSSKLQKRIVVFKGDDDFKKNCDNAILPKEYGGKLPMAKMIEMFKEEIRERQDRLVDLDKMRVDLQTMTTKPGDKCGATSLINGIGLPGSFRKLEID